MGHNSETQNHSDDVPNTIRRGAIYYFKRRIPTHLVRAEAFGLKKSGKPVEFLRCSLKTSDPRVARRRAALENAEAEKKFLSKEQELAAGGNAQFAKSSAAITRKLSALTEPEMRDLIIQHFVAMERERDRLALSELDSGERNEVAQTIAEDLADYTRQDPRGDWSAWDKSVASFLESKGIQSDGKDSKAYRSLKDLFRRSYVEHYTRSLDLVEQGQYREHDQFFRRYGAETLLAAPETSAGETIGRLRDSYLEHRKASGVSQAMLDKYPMEFRLLADFFGEGKELRSIAAEEAKQFVDFLGKIPKNCTKRYPSLTLVKAAEREAKKENPELVSAKTQKNHFTGISAIFNYAVGMEWMDKNPMSNKVVSGRLSKVNRKNKPMLSAAEMSLIFGSEEFLRERNATLERERGDARFWVPLLCLFHGFRTNEVCQLYVADVKNEDGIDFLYLRESDDEGNKVKRLKTVSSRRKVPLHKEIIAMGFLEFVESRKARCESCLFPSLEANRRGSKADTIGKWFGRLRNKLLKDIPDIQGAKGLHSLRHSFARTCRDKGIEQGLIWALGGWTEGTRRNSEADYGSGYGLPTLKAAIDKIEFPGVDMSPLYPSDADGARGES